MYTVFLFFNKEVRKKRLPKLYNIEMRRDRPLLHRNLDSDGKILYTKTLEEGDKIQSFVYSRPIPQEETN